ncbi:MAG: murein transglycosylase [Rhodospirillales bacterium]|nr:MAG: murein transglycosylase [Rhodospirillales bacterium]
MVVVGAALVAACTSDSTRTDVSSDGRVSFASLASWSEEDHRAALDTFLISCERLMRMPAERPTPLAGPGGRMGDWQAACSAGQKLGGPDRRAARDFFETTFQPVVVATESAEGGLFTGYYEPELQGSRRSVGRYRYPLYGVPDDLVTLELGDGSATANAQARTIGRVHQGSFVPYHDRAAIQRGALDGRGLELVWVDDPVDAFFLHIQGSGRVVLEDGTVLRVGFAGRNGHPYVPIGRVLVDRGDLPRDLVSMQSIRAWLKANPDQAEAVMAANPSYIFFAIVNEAGAGDGPRGALGVALTAERSLAVDPSIVPLGAPVWVETVDPLDEVTPWHRLMVAQDTGTAIKGPGRGDVFWGSGALAAERAGRMRARGRMVLLVPRAAAPST